MGQNSDKSRNVIRVSNMLTQKERKKQEVVCYICFQLKSFHSSAIAKTTKLTILNTEWEFTCNDHVLLHIEYIDVLKTSIILSSICSSTVCVCYWIGISAGLRWPLSKICILAYLFVRQPPRCIVKVLQSLFNIISTLYMVSDCIERNNVMNWIVTKLHRKWI